MKNTIRIKLSELKQIIKKTIEEQQVPTNTQNNQSGATYIYAAFAENPFVSSTFVPTTAR